MSYLIYINDLQIETYSQSFALTKQNNDIADISNRNADFSQNIKIPRTATNTKILQTAGLISRNSNIPYQKNTAQIIDTDTGVHLVLNGWAVLINTDAKDYNLSIYSGNINFFKAIENIVLTDVGLEELNHIKNIDNVIETWNDTTLPYRYILADYNGKFLTNDNKINIDYQVPSANIKYLWDRIFNFIGFEYEGEVFNNEEFRDLWVSYPKPVPTNAPNLTLITLQNSIIVSEWVQQPSGEYVTFLNIALLPTQINTPEIIPFNKFTQAGSYLFKVSGGATSSGLDANGQVWTINYKAKIKIWDNLGNIFLNDTEINNEIIVNVGVDFRFTLYTDAYGYLSNSAVVSLSGSFQTEINKITGYTLGFDQAFIDFKVSDFIKEIMMRFALTPFAIPNTNKVKFLTLDEIFQDTNVQDWSDKFHGVTNESYTISRYAQNNLFKFKYNDTNANHNDSKIIVNNENIKEEGVLFASRFFSPDKKISTQNQGNVYPIWTKNIKDNNTVEYKELDNRFYLLRSQIVINEINIGSDLLGLSDSTDLYYKESYYRCKWFELINVWYKNINKLLDFTKVVTANIYLKPFEFSQLQMERLVFINQLGSYFLINKVSNFVPNKATKVELVKVEYYSDAIDVTPSDPYVTILSYSYDNCEVTFVLDTNLINGQLLTLHLSTYVFDVFFTGLQEYPTYTPVQGTILNNEITFSLSQFNIQQLITGVYAQLKGFTSAFVSFQSNIFNITTDYPLSCYVQPIEPTTLTLLNAVLLFTDLDGAKKYKLTYDFSTITPNQYEIITEVFASVPFTLYSGTTAEKTFDGWTNITSDLMSQTFFGGIVPKEINVFLRYINIALPNTITKIRVKINSTISNEINI